MRRLFKYASLIIVIIFCLTVFLGLQIQKIRINNDIICFLPENHSSRQTLKTIQETFGDSKQMIIAVNVEQETILTKKNLKIIKEIAEELENRQNIEQVTSLVNVDYIEGSNDGMKVSALVEKLPESDKEILIIKEKLLSWDLYKNNLYSEDFKSTQLLVNIASQTDAKDQEEVYYQIKDVLKKYENENMKFYISGISAINALIGVKMQEDMRRLIPFIAIIILTTLYLFFNRLNGVILTMITVIISTLWAVGLMGYLGIEMSLVSTVIPVLLIAVGSAYGIHFINHYYDELKHNTYSLSKEKHFELVIEAVRKVGKPIGLAGLTTVVGFGSLATSTIIPIRDFGIFTAFGVGIAVLVALTFVPALLIVKPTKWKEKKQRHKDDFLTKTIIILHNYLSDKKVEILLLTVLIIVFSINGMTKIVIDTPMIEVFKETTEIRIADKFENKTFAGTATLDVVIEGPEKGSMTNPEILKAMDDFAVFLTKSFPEVGKVTSFTDFIKRMNRVMNCFDEPNVTDVIRIDSNYTDYDIEDSDTEFAFNADEMIYIQDETSNFYSEDTANFDTDSFYIEETTNFGDEPEFSNQIINDFTETNFSGEDISNFTDEIESTTVISDSSLSGSSTSMDTEVVMSVDQKLSTDELVQFVSQIMIEAGQTNLTAAELVEKIQRELNYQGAAYNEIPYDVSKYPVATREELKNLISQYLLLYSGSLDEMIDDQLAPKKAKMIIQLKTWSNVSTNRIKQKIIEYVEANFPKGYQVSVSGFADMGLAANNLIIISQIKSIIISFVIVFLIVTLSFKSLSAGLYGIIPLGVSLLINFGLMGYLGIKLDIGTAMAASVVIGIGVDYTIHFLATYNYERKRNNDLEIVTKNALISTGKAIIFNAVSVAAGFIVLVLSNFYPLKHLGFLIGITMFTSSIAALTILPALLNLFKPDFIKK